MARQSMKERLDQLEAENEKLKMKVQEAGEVEPDVNLDYFNEMQKLKRSGRDDSNKIVVKQIVDHKNISLWTKWGKRVGPLHPKNAEQVYERFFNISKTKKRPWVRLLADQPTEKQIEAWKQTFEGKAWLKEFNDSRKKKEGSRKKGAVDRLADQMSKMYGLKKEQMFAVKDSPVEVDK
jgi:hypothetical protein